MTYFESVFIVRGQKVGIMVAVLITAAISPTWFDCSVPGIHIEVLRSLFGFIHMPLPHLAFSFPLSKHAPSVYTVTAWLGRLIPDACLLLTGDWESRLGSAKILKHSVRSVLQAISGSNIVFSLFSSAAILQAFLVWVREKLSRWVSPTRGLNFGASSLILWRASFVHSCGFLQPIS